MKVTIDLVADAAAFVWGERAKGASTTAEVPGRGVRLMLSAAGDVVGIEVLGWSARTADPSEVAVRVAGVADVLAEDDPLARALAGGLTAPVSTSSAGRPVDDGGQPMITVREAAQIIGRERSWITRQLHAGALRGRKIGNEWWTTRDWALHYRHTRSTTQPQPAKSN